MTGRRKQVCAGALVVGLTAAFAACTPRAESPPADSPLSEQRARERMVREQIERRGVSNPRVLAALRAVPRHRFVPPAAVGQAHADHPLPIGHRQTISQPYIVASMTELVDPQPGDRVLEIGTGSGYQAAVLARLTQRVYSIEIVPELAKTARQRLRNLGYTNIEVISADGYHGLPEHAPFDGIVVTAAPERIPPPLLEQLAVGARLVIPVGRHNQQLKVIERTPTGLQEQTHYPVRFVPLTRRAGPELNN